MNSESCELSLITPMYNEADNIQRNIWQIIKAMEALEVSWEYILIDDGSTDNSLEKAHEILDKYSQCRIIHYPHNRGRGYALRHGFAVAQGKYVITTESDLSWGKTIIEQLWDALKTTGADMVIASVYAPGGGMENVPSHRRFLSKFGNVILRWTFGGNISMLSGMTRGYRREAIQAVYLEQNRKEIHLEIADKFQVLGFQITEIPGTIRWEPPKPERSRRRDGWGILKFVIPHLSFSFHRGAVRISYWLATLTGLLGMLFVIIGTLDKLFEIFPPLILQNLPTYGLLLLSISLLVGFFCFISIQLQFMYASITHLQSQIKIMQLNYGQTTRSPDKETKV